MSTNIDIQTRLPKSEKYEQLIPQLSSLIRDETDLTANLANISAGLKQTFNWWWVGFYLVKGDELVLGPFQGPVACTRIKYGRGVCGTAWKEQKSLFVPDVHKFPGHIACSSESVAEIVVPVFNSGQMVAAILDIDSESYDVLDETDVKFLEEICSIISKKL